MTLPGRLKDFEEIWLVVTAGGVPIQMVVGEERAQKCVTKSTISDCFIVRAVVDSTTWQKGK